MIIHLSPRVPVPGSSLELSVSVDADTVTVNGQAFDFSHVAEGESMPYEEIGADYFAGPALRESGEIHVSLILPHDADASSAVRFPSPVHIKSGRVALPR